MDVDGELELLTRDPFCRQVEETLRRAIYQWKHMPADMVVEGKFYSPLVIHDSEFGIVEEVDVVQLDEKSSILSRDFRPQIDSERDLEKIKLPIVTHDLEASERNYQDLVDAFGDILPIEKVGIVHYWFAPWDELIRWWDVERALTDLVVRPGLVHEAMERLTNAYLARLEQWQEQNLLSVTEGNYRVGSGGLGHTEALPQPDFDCSSVRPADQWAAERPRYSLRCHQRCMRSLLCSTRDAGWSSLG
jgi:hypothetical protein